jgi:hypothetical protein
MKEERAQKIINNANKVSNFILAELKKDIEALKSVRGSAHVIFKSTPENWNKERDGRKPNTFRKIDEEDSRFLLLRMGVNEIFMQNSETGEEFHRFITDYTEWDGYAIISWKHKEVENK